VSHWLDSVQPGDVIRFKSGALRTVLDVWRDNGRVRSVTFPILHCSWTKRGYTVYRRGDLTPHVLCLTRAKMPLHKFPLAQRLIKDLHTNGPPREGSPSCCDVVGVFE
jgi:hypothetical protein